MDTPAECFRIDDFLDFSNEHFTNTTTTATTTTPSSTATHSHHQAPPQNPFTHHHHHHHQPFYSDFTTCLPSDDVADLEWLSRFVDDSLHDFPATKIAGSAASFSGGSRSRPKKEPDDDGGSPSAAAAEGGVRRCSHCSSEKTPQWRTGPMGPKTLCNACGVRYKSGRLVPEYRPASSPTFVLTQHSNSHRKVMELRRQKELMRQHRHHQEQ